MPRNRSSIADLRRVIDRLPVRTREAMLEGIRANDIIVGAYSDRDGGVCPMLAAHRCGGRTSLVAFARTWDAFTKVKRARRATARELRILDTQLRASLAAEPGEAPAADLSAAIAAHRRGLRAGRPVDLAGAITSHQKAVRERRTLAAASTGGWEFLREGDGRRVEATPAFVADWSASLEHEAPHAPEPV